MQPKLQKSLTDEEWKEVAALGPGVRMFRGKQTLFYNGGEIPALPEENSSTGEPRHVIVLPGVKIIPERAFNRCTNIETVIMADSVKRIEEDAFNYCVRLEFVKLSTNLEIIGYSAFLNCHSLTSIFIPPSCRGSGNYAFLGCKKLIILNVSNHTRLGYDAIADTALIKASHFRKNEYGAYSYETQDQIKAWVKNMNQGEEYALHRACSSFNPLTEIISEIVKRDGLQCFKKENEIGITPVQYLDANPFAEIDQIAIAKRYVLEMMGEIL